MSASVSMIGPERTPVPGEASILIVDDVPANLLALSAVLKPLGVRIVEARSGREALEHIAREAFAVALLDVQMPEMDGFDTAAHIRQMDMGRELPIIFLTAIHSDDRFVRRGYSAGGADYITKPFDADIVRARVSAFVKLFQQREEVRRAQVELRTHERDEAVRRLVAFEQIATAALQSSELPVFLRELLAIFMSAADDADSASILLRHGDELRVQACVGLNEEVDERYAVVMGESFAGTAAAERRPIEIRNAAESNLVKSEWIRSRGTRVLYAVPLLHGDDVLGVAHIGSIRAAEFSESEKRLFGAMADRASWGVAEHLKRARLAELQEERAQLLELERKARREAEVANRMKDEFLATISHELRTPLNAILGWTVIARASAAPEIDRALGIVERNARAQARILEDVLDISRVVSGNLRLETTEVALRDVVTAACDAVRPAAQAKNIELAITLPESIVLVADAQRLQQVVWNLLSNAIKFTPKGGSVEVNACATPEGVCLLVTDSGQGIDPAFLPHVFEPFRQADASTNRQHSGLGLGLAIVKQIVDAHGGTIAAASEGPDRGSSFRVELPSRAPSSQPEIGDPHDRAVPSVPAPGAVRLDDLKILVVDDDADARALLVHVLTSRGASVAQASSAAAGLEQVTEFRPHVLVSDIAMPGGDGYGLLRDIRGLEADRGGKTPAIALTAHARAVDADRAREAGFAEHLCKPVDLGHLISVVLALGSAERVSRQACE